MPMIAGCWEILSPVMGHYGYVNKVYASTENLRRAARSKGLPAGKQSLQRKLCLRSYGDCRAGRA
jgi:hypothetical protein